MHLTLDRLMVLMALYRGTYENELRVSTSHLDLAYLIVEGFVIIDPSSRRPGLTDKGYSFVDVLLGKALTSESSSIGVALTAYRGTYALDDQCFFLVVSGDCSIDGPSGRPVLKKPLTATIQPSCREAEHDAQHLARVNRGEKFFVMQAVSVHEVPLLPISSKRL